MQVWSPLHAARWKCKTQKSRQKSPSGHDRTTLWGYIFAAKAGIDNRKKTVKQQYVLHMSPQYGELRPTNGWDPSGSLRHPCKFQRVSRLGSVTARQSSSGRQPNFAALNRGRHLCSAGRPSGWALAHILVFSCNPIFHWRDALKYNTINYKLNHALTKHLLNTFSHALCWFRQFQRQHQPRLIDGASIIYNEDR